MDTIDRFLRIQELLGEDFERLRQAKILLLGVGGVGGFCLDCLYRSGVSQITIVDSDIFEISNQNRQIGSELLGQSKVKVLSERYDGVVPVHARITKEWVESFDFDQYDLVLDAIDDILAKVAVAKKVYNKLISSTGSAKKLDPSKIMADSIWKSYGDKLAKKFREALKKEGCHHPFMVIFSPEDPRCETLGSFCGVTGSFGLRMASEAIRQLLQKE